MADNREDFNKFIQLFQDSPAEICAAAGIAIIARLLESDDPGFFVSNESGFTWSKSVDWGNTTTIKISKLEIKADAAILSVTAGAHFDEEGDIDNAVIVANFDGITNLKFSWRSSGSFIKMADPLKDSSSSPTPLVYGFENPRPVDFEGPLACVGFTIEMKRAADRTMRTNVTWQSLNAPFTPRILALSFDKVLVFPWLNNLGIYVKELILDLSDEASSNVALDIPGVTDPGWKGIYAKNLSLMMKLNDDWYAIGGGDIVIGNDEENWGAKLRFTYTNQNPEKSLQSIAGELLIAEHKGDTSLRGTVEAGFYLNGFMKAAVKKFEANSALGDRYDCKARELTDKLKHASIEGILKCSMSGFGDGDGLAGLDISLKAVEFPGGLITASQAGFALPSDFAKYFMPVLATSLCVYWLLEEDTGKASAAAVLLILALTDIYYYWDEDTYPNVFTVNGFNFRFIHWHQDGQDKNTFQFRLSCGANYKINGKVWKAFVDMIHLKWFVAPFGLDPHWIETTGLLGLQLNNLGMDLYDPLSDDVNSRLSKLLPSNEFAITATSFPKIEVVKDPAGSQAWKEHININRVEAIIDNGAYGVALYLDGLGGKIPVTVTPGGIAFFFSPDFDVKLLPPTLNDIPFKMLYPGWVLASGSLAIDKPLPGAEGSFSKLSLDVGIVQKHAAGDKYSVDNYKYRFYGIFAKGSITVDPQYDFWFVSVGFEGDLPIAEVFGIEWYGLAGMGGNNIGPGCNSGAQDASALLQWLLPAGDTPRFTALKNWDESGGGWHPVNHENVGGGMLRFGAASGSFIADVAVIVSSNWWMAAGLAYLKALNGKIGVVVVSNDSGLIARGMAKFVKENVYEIKGIVEIGSVTGHDWFYLGHYDESRGGPIVVDLLKIWKVRAYFIYDSKGFENFGLTVDSKQSRPNLPGPALGFGAVWEFKPPQLGPDWLNIQVYAGIGLNVAYRCEPFLLYGDFYLAGYLQLKVWWFKFKVGLSAYLAGMVDGRGTYAVTGTLTISVGLPWPLPDVDADVSFDESNGTPELEEPPVNGSLGASMLMAQQRKDLSVDSAPAIPVDSILAVRFNKPINCIVQMEGDADVTELMIADNNATTWTYTEKTETNINSKTYSVEYRYTLNNFRMHSGGETVTKLPAAWMPPDIISEDAGQQQPAHQVLYLNTWDFTNALSVQPEQIGTYWDRVEYAAGSACAKTMRVTIPDGKYPPVYKDDTNQYFVCFVKEIGTITIREQDGGMVPYARQGERRLAWAGNGVSTVLNLPLTTRFIFPPATDILINCKASFTPGIAADVGVRLRGGSEFEMRTAIWYESEGPATMSDTFHTLDGCAIVLSEGRLTIGFKSKEGHPVEEIRLTGLFFRTMKSYNSHVSLQLALVNMTLSFNNIQGSFWQRIMEDSSGGAGNIDPDTIWDSFLFEKGRNYQIEGDVLWDAYLNGEKNKSGSRPLSLSFATEADPSQDVSRYIAFTAPSNSGSSLYPRHMAVAIGFKYRALIKKIFEKHYGPGALLTQIVDTGGTIVPVENSFVIDASVGVADPWLEQMLADCLTAAQGMTFTMTSYTTQEMETNTRYALRLRVKEGAAITDPNYSPERWSMPFVTSRYQTFDDHMNDLNGALIAPETIPALSLGVQSPFTVATDCLNRVYSKTAPGYDDLVESLYIKLAGVNSGWLGEQPGVKKTTHAFRIIAGADTMCVVLEPLEPILDKQGISINGVPVLEDKGIILLDGGFILLHDRCGGRMLLFRTEAGAVVPYSGPVTVSVTYDPGLQIDQEVRNELLQSLEANGYDMARLGRQSGVLTF
jgi:hypothetical protein